MKIRFEFTSFFLPREYRKTYEQILIIHRHHKSIEDVESLTDLSEEGWQQIRSDIFSVMTEKKYFETLERLIKLNRIVEHIANDGECIIW